MAVEEIKIVGVEHRGERGELVVAGHEIRFSREREIEVKPDYAPQYTTETRGEARAFALEGLQAAERSGERVLVRLRGGDEEFRFEREADAANFVAAVEERTRTRG